MSGARVLTEEQRDELAKRYRKDQSVTILGLATEYGVSTAPIKTALRESGVRIRDHRERRRPKALEGRR